MKIDWQDPPEHVHIIGSGSKAGKHLQFALELRKHPGRWAVMPDPGVTTEGSAMAKAQNIRRGKVKGFAPGEYEAGVDGTTIYVRFIGKNVTPVETEPEPEPEDKQEDEQEEEPPAGGSLAPQIRQWATDHGYDVPERGRLPRKIIDDYWEARGGRPPSIVRVVQ